MLEHSTMRRFYQWAEQYSPICQLRCAFDGALLCCHPDVARLILVRGDPKEPETYKAVRTWLGDSILLSHGPQWHRKRKMLTPAFHLDVLRSYVTALNEAALVLKDKWADQVKAGDRAISVEVYEDMILLTFDCIMNCVFGQNNNTQVQYVDLHTA
jgi:cytochrome P450